MSDVDVVEMVQHGDAYLLGTSLGLRFNKNDGIAMFSPECFGVSIR